MFGVETVLNRIAHAGALRHFYSNWTNRSFLLLDYDTKSCYFHLYLQNMPLIVFCIDRCEQFFKETPNSWSFIHHFPVNKQRSSQCSDPQSLRQSEDFCLPEFQLVKKISSSTHKFCYSLLLHRTVYRVQGKIGAKVMLIFTHRKLYIYSGWIYACAEVPAPEKSPEKKSIIENEDWRIRRLFLPLVTNGINLLNEICNRILLIKYYKWTWQACK